MVKTQIVVLAAAAIPLVAACGGVAIDATTGGSDAGTHRDTGARDVQLREATIVEPPPDAGDDGSSLPPYVDNTCPDVAAPQPMFLCDPIHRKTTDCPVGFACYPFPPQGQNVCNPGPYGTSCAREGTGIQGSPCGAKQGWCVFGLVCVVTGSGD